MQDVFDATVTAEQIQLTGSGARICLRPVTAVALVTHEWATLRHVVVGRPHYRLPAHLPAEREAHVPSDLWRRAKRLEGRTLADAMPSTFARCSAQMAGAVRLLRRWGVRVSRVPSFLPGEEAWLAATHSESQLFFPRDPTLVLGATAFELTTADPRRRRERGPMRRLLRRRYPGVLERIASMTFPEPPERSDGGVAQLDGGDCLVAGRTVLVGVSRGGSNSAGADWLRQRLGAGWTVHEVPFHEDFPHLDCALSLVRPGLGLIAPDGVAGGPPRGFGRWRWIEVDRKEALEAMAINGVPLDASTLLLPDAARTTAAALRAVGHTVLTVPFDAVTGFGGGLRCWTLPLGRWD